MRNIFFLLAFIILSLPLQAQVTLWEELKAASQDSTVILPDTTAFEPNQSLYVPDSWDTNLDSLLNSLHVKYYTKRSDNRVGGENVVVSDSVYIDRLSRLPRVIELPYNEIIRTCIDLYVDRRRNLMEYMLGLADFYFPMIEQTLDRYGLPLELKYLAVVESALNPTIVSRAGACGLWQFILPTGKMYGLEINSLVDERRDPVKATDAACRYFKDMYEIFGDWNLVIAAYNCGPGGVKKAINRANGSSDYWEIYPYLPKETRTYVPLFIAANYAMNYYAEHNLIPVQAELPLSTDTVMISQQIHFDQIAEVLKMDKEQLRLLNPQYKRDIVPGNFKPYALLLPSVHAYGFAGLEDTIAHHRADEFFANRTFVGKGTGSNKEKVNHKVVSGESVTTIADKYGVTASDVRKWNGLRSNKVGAGRRLTIYTDNGGYALASKGTETTKKTTSGITTGKSNSSTYARYKVQTGDSFYIIAKKFPGYDAQDLMKMNNMKSSSLRAGQYINVPNV